MKITKLGRLALDAAAELDRGGKKDRMKFVEALRSIIPQVPSERPDLEPNEIVPFDALVNQPWLPPTELQDEARTIDRTTKIADLLENDDLTDGQKDELITFCLQLHDLGMQLTEIPSYDGLRGHEHVSVFDGHDGEG